MGALAASLALSPLLLPGVARAEPRLDGKCLLGVLGHKDDSLRARALWRSLGPVAARTRPVGDGFLRTYPAAGVEARLDGRGVVRSLRLVLRARRGAELRPFRGAPPFRLDPAKLNEKLRVAAARPGGAVNRFRFQGLDVSLRLQGAPASFTEITIASDPDEPAGELTRFLRRCPYRRLAALGAHDGAGDAPRAGGPRAVPAGSSAKERADTTREDAALAERAVDRGDELRTPPVFGSLSRGARPRVDGDCLIGLLGRSLDGPEVASLEGDLGAPDRPSSYQLVFPRGLEVGGSFFDKRTVKEIHIDKGGAAPFPGLLPRLPPKLLAAAAADAAGFALWNDGRVIYRLFVDATGAPRKLTLLREADIALPLYGCAYAAELARKAEN